MVGVEMLCKGSMSKESGRWGNGLACIIFGLLIVVWNDIIKK